MARKYKGENQNCPEEKSAVYQTSFSPLLSRAKSFFFFSGNMIISLCGLPPTTMVLRNEEFIKIQKTLFHIAQATS